MISRPELSVATTFETLPALLEHAHHDIDAVMLWGGYRLALSYKYDVGLTLEAVYGLLEDMSRYVSGEGDCGFSSNTFRGKWHVIWGGSRVHIDCEWDAVVCSNGAGVEGASSLDVDTAGFLQSWKGLIDISVGDIVRCVVEWTPTPADLMRLSRDISNTLEANSLEP